MHVQIFRHFRLFKTGGVTMSLSLFPVFFSGTLEDALSRVSAYAVEGWCIEHKAFWHEASRLMYVVISSAISN